MSFRFLNEDGAIATAADWNAANRAKLWLYNLHYFEDLAAADARAKSTLHRELIDRWVQDNPPAAGVGWEPYPTSLRIVNWIKWVLAGNELGPSALQSLAVQARWLDRRIERHIQGNHVIVNAKALVFAGCVFSGAEADGWRRRGLRILDAELRSQILNDGGHVERSPMYHSLILEDVLDLINAACAWRIIPRSANRSWRIGAGKMLGWLGQMIHPDGGISFFNDAAFGIAPTPAELGMYAERLRIDVPASPRLSDSGYVRLSRANAVLIADAAPVGPRYQPGHAHADTLSFELSLRGFRVIVNSGTSTYEIGAQRQFERSTAAHNTVEIDGRDSSEVWAGFRVARRASPIDVVLRESSQCLLLRAAHDGYRRGGGNAVHARSWALDNGGLRVTDGIRGAFATAVARYHFHPSVNVDSDGGIDLPDGSTAKWRVSGGTARIVPGHWHPEFGTAIPNKCVEIAFAGREAALEVNWEGR